MNRSLRLLTAVLALASTLRLKAGRGTITDEDRNWWAYRMLPAQVPVPQPADAEKWVRNAVDAFILEVLRSAGLEPAADASREVLGRRLYLDVTGLPPSAAEADAFINDVAPDAWERLVDRLLDSPRYGEKWGRHWLDLVRYADSDGYKADDYRPDAGRYRDYVIASFNEDKPYDRFVMEQLAGDELDPDNPDAVTATGYLRCGIYEYNNRDAAGQWEAMLNDITDTTADVFLGLGLQCARCHDHKFDPLLQKDYYRLQAFFAPLEMPEHSAVANPQDRAVWQEKLGAWEVATAEIRQQIEEVERPHRERIRKDATEKFPPETQEIMARPAAEQTAEERPVFELAWRQVTYEWDRLDGRIKGSEKEKLLALRKELAEFDSLKPAPLPAAMTGRDMSARAPRVTIPGNAGAGEIALGFLTILQPKPAPVTPLARSTGRRSALAKWIASPENPLTARVLVNRVWQQHFGRGLSATTSDFGTLGEIPSHPALLDWLARRFIADGWSAKKLHRLILNSAAWRQSTISSVEEKGRLADPENRLLWRWNTRRLDYEQIRDSIHAATGELNMTAGGPGADHTKPRRAVYLKVLRNVRDLLADVFDAPQHFNSTPTRDTTTTAAHGGGGGKPRFCRGASDSGKSIRAHCSGVRCRSRAAASRSGRGAFTRHSAGAPSSGGWRGDTSGRRLFH